VDSAHCQCPNWDEANRQIVVLELVDPLQVELDVGLALLTERPKLHCISLTAQIFYLFRTEVLRRARVPEDLTRLWLGHSKETVTDYYAGGLKNDSAWRQEWSERVGLGFSLNGLLGLQKVVPIDSAKVA
jgi:hypothetical protein